ncbi:A2 protein [Diplonema papillatum]|nr:A2 protein [Diplonema papillatum]
MTGVPLTAVPLPVVPQTVVPIPMTVVPLTVVPLPAVPQTVVPIPMTEAPLPVVPQTVVPIPMTEAPLPVVPQTVVPIPMTEAPLPVVPQTVVPVPNPVVPLSAVPLTVVPLSVAPVTTAPLSIAPLKAPVTMPPLTVAPLTLPRTFAPLVPGATFSPLLDTAGPVVLPSLPAVPIPAATASPGLRSLTDAPIMSTFAPPPPPPITAYPSFSLTFLPATIVASSPGPPVFTTAPTLDPAEPSKPAAPPGKAATVIPEGQRQALTATIGTAAASSAIAGGVGATLVVLQGFTCQVDDVDLEDAVPLDWEMHPSRTSLGRGPGRYMLAALIVNPLLVVGIAAVLFAAASAVHLATNQPWRASLGLIRAPGVLHIPFVFLVQGTSLVAARLAFYPKGSILNGFIGWVVLLLCAASPLALHATVIRKLGDACMRINDPRLSPDDPLTCRMMASVAGQRHALEGWKRVAYRWAFGDTICVNRANYEHFAEMYGTICDTYKEELAVFACLELCHVVVLSLLAAWRPPGNGECTIRNGLITLLFVCFTVAILTTRPYASPLDNSVAFVSALLMTNAVLLMTLGIWLEASGDSLWFSAAGLLLLITAVIAFAKALWDVLLYIFDLFIQRRSAARQAARRSSACVIPTPPTEDDRCFVLTEPTVSVLSKDSPTIPYHRVSTDDIVLPLELGDGESVVSPSLSPLRKASDGDRPAASSPPSPYIKPTLSPATRSVSGGGNPLSSLSIDKPAVPYRFVSTDNMIPSLEPGDSDTIVVSSPRRKVSDEERRRLWSSSSPSSRSASSKANRSASAGNPLDWAVPRVVFRPHEQPAADSPSGASPEDAQLLEPGDCAMASPSLSPLRKPSDGELPPLWVPCTSSAKRALSPPAGRSASGGSLDWSQPLTPPLRSTLTQSGFFQKKHVPVPSPPVRLAAIRTSV